MVSQGVRMSRFISLFAITLLLASCTVREESTYYKSIPPLSQVPGVGVSFVIPNEDGWAFFDPNGKGATIVKSGKTKIESYVISLLYMKESSPISEGKFQDLYDKLEKDETESSRYKAHVIENEFSYLHNNSIVNFYYFIEDHGAIKLPNNSNHMLLEAMGIITVDPNRPDTLLKIAYTHRYAPGNEDPNFKEKAKWVLDHVEFIKQ